MNNFTVKQMVLVSRVALKENEFDFHDCALLEIDGLKEKRFMFGNLKNEDTGYLSDQQITSLLQDKKLIVDESRTWTDIYTFEVIGVLVSEDGKMFLDYKNIVRKGNLSEKKYEGFIFR